MIEAKLISIFFLEILKLKIILHKLSINIPLVIMFVIMLVSIYSYGGRDFTEDAMGLRDRSFLFLLYNFIAK